MEHMYRAWHKGSEKMSNDFNPFLDSGITFGEEDFHEENIFVSDAAFSPDIIVLKYAGATAENGANICEGDILATETGLFIGVVEYAAEEAKFVIRYSTGAVEGLSERSHKAVLGNKYQDKHLLNKKGA